MVGPDGVGPTGVGPIGVGQPALLHDMLRRLVICLSPVLAAACGSDSASEFGPPRTLGKEQRPIVWNASAKERLGLPDVGAIAAAGDAAVRYVGDTPAGWEQAPPARFRDAVWRIAGQADADCYLTAGVGGGVAGNLTRWYGQIGAGDVPNVEALPLVDLMGRPARLVELTGTFGGKPGFAMLIAFFADGEQVTSLKFTGPESVVIGNRDKFLALARSLRKTTASPDPKAPPIQPGQPMPDNHPPVAGAPSQPATSPAAAPFSADVPADWKPRAGTSRALHHSFGQDGEVYVSQLGGGLDETLNIWRSEMGQAPLDAKGLAALPRAPFLGDDAVLMDMSGTFRSLMGGKSIENARTLIVARGEQGNITFAKLVGPAADVAAQVDAFRRFCASVRRNP
jgi:hypothetical protein